MKKRVYRDWPEVTAAWRASGKSKKDFCQEMGINRNGFDKNLRRVSPKQGAQNS
jgi:DNA-binding CsgD family transcriptional regulator